MKKLPKHLEWRRHVQKRYNDELAGFIQAPPHSETVQYYCAKVNPEIRDDLISYLASKKIHTSVHFKPLHLYNVVKGMNQRDYPVANVEWKKLISLPPSIPPGLELLWPRGCRVGKYIRHYRR